MLEAGKKAPDFELPDQDGVMHKLSDYAGKKVILYFYPKDNTPGCTKQACGFSERYPQFAEKGAVILGVSKDSVASHKRFEEKYGLAFTLLADPERKVIEAYDVWKEKKNYGKISSIQHIGHAGDNAVTQKSGAAADKRLFQAAGLDFGGQLLDGACTVI